MSWNQAELPGRADSKDCTDIMYVNAKCSALSVIFEEECIALLLNRYWSTEELKKKKKKEYPHRTSLSCGFLCQIARGGSAPLKVLNKTSPACFSSVWNADGGKKKINVC